MKIVFLDANSLGADCDLSCFEEFGEVVIYAATNMDEVSNRISDADWIFTNKVVINKNAIDGAPNLKYIGICATGTDNVDVKYAVSRGIAVTNVMGYSTETVVQHTFALLFSVMEQLEYYDGYIKSGEYSKSRLFTYLDKPFMELANKTYGIVGLGNIGKRVAAVASAFGCKVIYYSTTGKNSNPDYERVDWDTLLKQSDVVSIHSPLTEETKGLFNMDAFKKMKKSAFLINVGRGPIVVEEDLRNALDEGLIAGAGLDVFSKEPLGEESPLLALKEPQRIVMTPHIAWASVEARQRMVKELYANVKAFLAGEERNRCR